MSVFPPQKKNTQFDASQILSLKLKKKKGREHQLLDS
jgi:hypothetical protein